MHTISRRSISTCSCLFAPLPGSRSHPREVPAHLRDPNSFTSSSSYNPDSGKFSIGGIEFAAPLIKLAQQEAAKTSNNSKRSSFLSLNSSERRSAGNRKNSGSDGERQTPGAILRRQRQLERLTGASDAAALGASGTNFFMGDIDSPSASSTSTSARPTSTGKPRKPRTAGMKTGEKPNPRSSVGQRPSLQRKRALPKKRSNVPAGGSYAAKLQAAADEEPKLIMPKTLFSEEDSNSENKYKTLSQVPRQNRLPLSMSIKSVSSLVQSTDKSQLSAVAKQAQIWVDNNPRFAANSGILEQIDSLTKGNNNARRA